MGRQEKKGQLLIKLAEQQLPISGHGCRLLHGGKKNSTLPSYTRSKCPLLTGKINAACTYLLSICILFFKKTTYCLPLWCCWPSKCWLSPFLTCLILGVQDLHLPQYLAPLRSSQPVLCFLAHWLHLR